MIDSNSGRWTQLLDRSYISTPTSIRQAMVKNCKEALDELRSPPDDFGG
jgi:hypothetical protein